MLFTSYGFLAFLAAVLVHTVQKVPVAAAFGGQLSVLLLVRSEKPDFYHGDDRDHLFCCIKDRSLRGDLCRVYKVK